MARKNNKSKKKSLFHRLRIRIKRYYHRIMRILMAALIIIGIGYAGKVIFKSCSKRVTRTTVNSTDYNGIDVSKHNGKIDWAKVATDQRIQFVYIKATEGATRTDAMYQRNIDQARAQGIKVGSYHFFISWRSAKEQFENFRRQVNFSEQDLIPMIDVEEQGCRTATRAALQKNLNEFIQLIKQEYGVYPLLYSQYRFYNDNLAPEFNKYHIFIARYSTSKPTLRGKGKYNIWQFTENGRVDGISTPVDLDRFANGTKLEDILL